MFKKLGKSAFFSFFLPMDPDPQPSCRCTPGIEILNYIDKSFKDQLVVRTWKGTGIVRNTLNAVSFTVVSTSATLKNAGENTNFIGEGLRESCLVCVSMTSSSYSQSNPIVLKSNTGR
jgi:hypothetical protein